MSRDPRAPELVRSVLHQKASLEVANLNLRVLLVLHKNRKVRTRLWRILRVLRSIRDDLVKGPIVKGEPVIREGLKEIVHWGFNSQSLYVRAGRIARGAFLMRCDGEAALMP